MFLYTYDDIKEKDDTNIIYSFLHVVPCCCCYINKLSIFALLLLHKQTLIHLFHPSLSSPQIADVYYTIRINPKVEQILIPKGKRSYYPANKGEYISFNIAGSFIAL